MFVKMLQESFVKKTVVVKYHGKFYYINKARLNSTLNKMGMRARFDFVNENIKDYLLKNKLLYTEFLEFISDFCETGE